MPRVEVMHGVNLDQLGGRDPLHYGGLTLRELEQKIERFAEELGLEIAAFQTNSEGEFVERIHAHQGTTDALIVNAGAWSHYSYAIRDALEFAALPVVEVHISDISQREEWRKRTVFEDLENLIGRIYGKGADGYREALELIAAELRR
jgi:3-dehydroquinate dehydratase II